jgi:nitrate/nitrite transporter NarK
VVVVETLGQVISPTIAGAIFDRTGSYDGAILLFIGTYVASLVLFVVALRLPRPDLTRGVAELPVSRPAPTPAGAVAEMRESDRS